MTQPYQRIICDCEYWEEPCAFCGMNPIVAVLKNGDYSDYMRLSEMKAQ